MPGRDRTGPMCAGPGTGRGMGYCSGYNWSGFANQGTGFRGWSGFGRGGGGRGWRHRFFATGVPGWAATTPEQETADLYTRADWLKGQLDAIQKRIEELTSKESPGR
jgi:Family of unknown function (DUF5320)